MSKTPNPPREVSPAGGAPIGHGAPDEPANTLPAEPVNVTRLDTAAVPGAATSDAAGGAKRKDQDKGGSTEKRQDNEEPEPTLEEDLPSDGRDEKGEAMIRDLPARTGRTGAPLNGQPSKES